MSSRAGADPPPRDLASAPAIGDEAPIHARPFDAPTATEPADPEPPGVVREAEETIRRLGLRLAALGGGAVGLWGLVAWLGSGGLIVAYFPIQWLFFFLLGLLAFFFWPQTRDARAAREVLRRWDRVRADRALADAGEAVDPRLDVASSMARRIERHPASDDRTRGVVRALVARLRASVQDQRTLSLLEEAWRSRDLEEESRLGSVSDLAAHVESRISDLLGRLSELHATCVRRDAPEQARLLEEAEDLLRRLEAEGEVERILEGREWFAP